MFCYHLPSSVRDRFVLGKRCWIVCVQTWKITVMIAALFSCDTEYHYRHYYCTISIRKQKALECKQTLRFDSAGPISLFLSLHLTDRLIVTWNSFNSRQASSLFLQLYFFLYVIMLTSLYICAHSLSRAALSRRVISLRFGTEQARSDKCSF